MLVGIIMVVAAAGLLLGYRIRSVFARRQLQGAEQQAQHILREAEKEAETKVREAVLEAKDAWYHTKALMEKETEGAKLELQRQEQKVAQREENLERKGEQLDRREQECQRRDRHLVEREQEILVQEKEMSTLLESQRRRLEQVAHLTAAEAKQQLMDRMLAEARSEVAEKMRRFEEEAKELAQKRAGFYTSLAIQRFAADHVVESSVSVVTLPSEEMKGRIIGREGRNIRAFETATGVDLIIDDTPDAVVV
jgi:ribonuclease Y